MAFGYSPLSDDAPSHGLSPHDPGQTSNPTFLNPRSVSSHPIPSIAGAKPSAQVVFVPSNIRGKPPVRPMLSVSGVVTSTRKTSTTGKSVVYVPPTHTNMVNPPSSSGQPLGVKPVVN